MGWRIIVQQEKKNLDSRTQLDKFVECPSGGAPLLLHIYIYIYIILDAYRAYSSHLREQTCEDQWMFVQARRGPRAKSLGKHCPRAFVFLSLSLQTVEFSRSVRYEVHYPFSGSVISHV